MNWFWIIWGFDALIALIAIYFFLIGLSDGTVSARNMKMWLGLLLGLAVILGGSICLRSHGHTGMALSLLGILAIPGFLYALFMLVNLLSNERWN